MNQLKGTIDYTLTLEENNVWKLNYNQTIDNDIASIAITQHVLGILEERLRLDKQSAKGKEVGFFTQRIDKVIQAKFGLSLMFDYTIKLYDIYMKGMAAKADEVAKEAAESLTEEGKAQYDRIGYISAESQIKSDETNPPIAEQTLDTQGNPIVLNPLFHDPNSPFLKESNNLSENKD